MNWGLEHALRRGPGSVPALAVNGKLYLCSDILSKVIQPTQTSINVCYVGERAETVSAARTDATKRGAIWKINLMGVGLVEHKIKMPDEQLMPTFAISVQNKRSGNFL